jgi:hypothetical protein
MPLLISSAVYFAVLGFCALRFSEYFATQTTTPIDQAIRPPLADECQSLQLCEHPELIRDQ